MGLISVNLIGGGQSPVAAAEQREAAFGCEAVANPVCAVYLKDRIG
ncbi:hypothetical protein [Pseudomonas mandelii]|nr:hypothetical protein [Pseudomonas mandelii]MCO8309380.1 hypothetical protein [Pseudomonas mandelii]